MTKTCFTCKHYLGEDYSGMFPAYMCDIPRSEMPEHYDTDDGCIMWEDSGLPPQYNKRYRPNKEARV